MRIQNGTITHAAIVAPRTIRHGAILAALLLGTGLVGLLQPQPVLAQAAAQDFSIPAQALSAALVQFSTSSGLQVVFDERVVSGRSSVAISGSLSPDAALTRLLSASGLSYRYANGNTITVYDPSAGSAAEDGSIVLEEVNVSAWVENAASGSGWQGNPDAVYETPAGVSVLTGDDLQQKYNGRVDDALRSMPGTFTRMDESGAGVAVNIRGFEGFNRVNMTIDGVRQNFRFFNHGNSGGNAYVDPALIADVDIARGAVVDASGIGSLAGAANFRTLDVEDIIRPGQDLGAMITAKAGTNGYETSVTTAGAFRTDGLSGAFAVSGHKSSDYRDGNGDVAFGTWQDLKSGLAKLHVGQGTDHSLSLGAVVYDNDTQFSSTAMPVKNQTYTAKYAYDPDNDLIDLRVNGYLNITEGDYQATSGSALVEDTGYGFDVTNTSQVDVGDGTLTLSYGGAYFRDDIDNGDNILLSVGKGTQEVSGVFASGQLNWGMFEATGGLRYDHYDITGVTQPFLLPAAPGNPVDNSGGAWSPKLTLAANVLPWLQLYGTYGHSFRPPTVSETLFPGVHGFGNGTFANPDLRGERSRGWEAGVNLRQDDLFFAGDALRLKANYFSNEITDYIALDLVDLQTFRIQFTNLPGTTSVKGIELQGSYDAGFAFVSLAYTKSDVLLPQGVYTGNGADNLGQLPEDYLTLGVGARFLDEKLTVGAQMRMVGKSYRTDTLNIPVPPPIPVDGYTLFDLNASYEINDNARAFISAQNITDEFYAPALKYHLGEPGPGRQIVGGISVRF